MGKKGLKIGFRRRGEVLIVKVLDMTNMVFYSKRISVTDNKGIAEMIRDLDAYGIDIKKIIMEDKEKRWW